MLRANLQREGGQARLLPKQCEGGQAALVIVMSVVFITAIFMARGIVPALNDTKQARLQNTSREVVVTAEAGVEDVTYRIRKALDYDDEEVLVIDGNYATTTVSDDFETGEKTAVSETLISDHTRRKSVTLLPGEEVVFNYAVHSGEGGFIMQNTASVSGNLFSNGFVSAVGNTVDGDVAVAETSGYLEDVYVTGNAQAHRITDSTIDGDAYYQTLESSTVNGTEHPDTDAPSSVEFSISDEKIDEWKDAAEAEEIVSCSGTYEITGNETIGPAKFPCNLTIKNSADVTIAGTVWVEGNIVIENQSDIYVDEDLGNKSVAVIADDPSDSEGSGRITLQNSTDFFGSGESGSFVFMISMNDSFENEGSTYAITLENSAGGDAVLYAPHGGVLIKNHTDVVSVSAYLIQMENNSDLFYDSGLESTFFEAGPGGSWQIVDWLEAQ